MYRIPLLRATGAALLISTLAGCSWLPFKSKKEAEPAPLATPAAAGAASKTPQAPAASSATIAAADLHGTWECQFQVKIGNDLATFTYTDQFNPDGTLKAQAYLLYELPSTKQQYSFVVQGSGHWRMQGSTITLIVPQVVKQDRSAQKHPELINDKDLVPEDLSDTWAIAARQGKNMRVVAGSLADEMLCHKED